MVTNGMPLKIYILSSFSLRMSFENCIHRILEDNTFPTPRKKKTTADILFQDVL